MRGYIVAKDIGPAAFIIDNTAPIIIIYKVAAYQHIGHIVGIDTVALSAVSKNVTVDRNQLTESPGAADRIGILLDVHPQKPVVIADVVRNLGVYLTAGDIHPVPLIIKTNVAGNNQVP